MDLQIGGSVAVQRTEARLEGPHLGDDVSLRERTQRQMRSAYAGLDHCAQRCSWFVSNPMTF